MAHVCTARIRDCTVDGLRRIEDASVVSICRSIFAALGLITISCHFSDVAAQSPMDALTPEQLMKRDSTEIATGLYSFGSFSARSIFVVTNDGVIATDPTDREHARAMRQAIADVTDRPVKYVIYSHQHWDHAPGGRIFKDEGATIISHENCVKHFESNLHPDIVMPDETVKGGEVVELGDSSLRLLYFGRNHGDCMLVMHLEGTDVLFVGDLVTPYSVGLGFFPDYFPAEYLRTLKELEAMEGWSRMVGNHGIPVAPKEALVQRRRYLESLMIQVKRAMDNGQLRGDALYQSIELPEEFRQMRGYKRQLPRAVERIYYYYLMGW